MDVCVLCKKINLMPTCVPSPCFVKMLEDGAYLGRAFRRAING